MFKIIRKCPKNYFQKFGSLFQNSQYYRMLYLTLGLNKYSTAWSNWACPSEYKRLPSWELQEIMVVGQQQRSVNLG